mgnify:CR=1 FL=1
MSNYFDEYKINVLNADASTEGSVAHAIAEIVEVDGGAIDKLKEISMPDSVKGIGHAEKL